jgi:hypothetical protein
MSRKPNAGPYVIDYADHFGKVFAQERHTWRDACDLMRALLVDNFINITVRFA